MNSLTVAYYTLLRNFRVKAMIGITLLPIILTLILGTALDVEFTPQNIERSKVGFFFEDESELYQAFKIFIESEEMKDILETAPISSYDEGIRLVDARKLDSFIFFPKGIFESIEQGENATIQHFSKNELSIVKPILDSFVQAGNIQLTILQLGDDGQQFGSKSWDGAHVEEIQIITEGKIPRGIDYYAIATLLQTLLMTGIIGVFSITKDLGNHTYQRLNSSPVQPYQINLGKLIGNTLTLYGVALFNVLMSKLLFKSNWGHDIGLILLIFFLFSIISSAIGMILAYVSKSTMISGLLLFVISTLYTFAAGGFSHKVTFQFFSPNTYAQEALFKRIYENFIPQSSLYSLLLYALIVVALTFIAGRRRLV